MLFSFFYFDRISGDVNYRTFKTMENQKMTEYIEARPDFKTLVICGRNDNRIQHNAIRGRLKGTRNNGR